MSGRIALLIVASALVVLVSGHAAAQDFSSVVVKTRLSIALVFVEQNDGSYVSGTGFAISGSPDLVTAAHVVSDSKSILVRFSDGSLQPGRPVLVWHEKDIAFVRVGRPLRSSLVGRENARPGEPVIVIGYPLVEKLGISHVSVTQGIVSAVSSYIRLNVAVNPGNSGGPVFDSNGRVLGVVSASLTGTGLAAASAWRDVRTARESQARGVFPVAVSLVDGQDYVTGWIHQGTVLVDARAMATILRGTVFWDPQSKSLTLAVAGRRLVLTTGSRYMDADGQRIVLPVPFSEDRRIPLKPVVSLLGGTVEIDQTGFSVWVQVPHIQVGARQPSAPQPPASAPATPGAQPVPIATQTPAPAPAPPPTIAPSPTPMRIALPDGAPFWYISPGMGIGPITLGLVRSAVEGVIGLPDDSRPQTSGVLVFYRRFGLGVWYLREAVELVSVSLAPLGVGLIPSSSDDVLRSLYFTASGVRLGDPSSMVLAAFGTPVRTSRNPQGVQVLEYRGVSFGIDDPNTVVHIVVSRSQ